MQDELTTLMHIEFCQTEEEELELRSDGVFFDCFEHGKMTFEQALEYYSITEDNFWKYLTYKHLLDFPKTKFEDMEYSISKRNHELYQACRNDREVLYLHGILCRAMKARRAKKKPQPSKPNFD